MSTRLVPVQAPMLQRVYDGVLHEMNPALTLEQWRSIFEWPWRNPEDHVGYALLDAGDRVVGFAGFIYSRQRIDGREGTFCNITSWVVKEPYRSSALSLVMPAVSRRDLTITNLTAIPAVDAIFTKLRFDVLETHTRVFYPVRPRGVRRYRILSGDRLRNRLPASEKQVFADHARLAEHRLAEGPRGSCYFVFSVGRRRGLRTARVYYMSDPDVFVDALPALQLQLLLTRGVPLVECDDRLVGSREVSFSRRIPLPVRRLFRSPSFEAREISNLYSEIPLLGL